MLARVFCVIPDIVFCIKDRDEFYRAANAAFAERLGLSSEEEVIGLRARDLFPPHLAETYELQDRKVLQQGLELVNQLELINNRDGSLGWYLASKFPMKDEGGKIIGLVSISRDLQTPSTGDLQMAGLQKISEWLRDHLDEEIHTVDLAQMAGMSPSQLERRMKRIFKLGVAQYVRKMRIERAAYLLRSTDRSIAEIALACGYSEQSSLTRQFKSAVGCPPGKYRQQETRLGESSA